MEDQIQTNREILRDIHSKTNEMYNVVIGNPKARQYGLVDKVHKLEKAESNRTKMYILVSSITAGISFAAHKLFDIFK
jgi:hypothetical protein